ncbi:hypothetical protein [Streptomyces sp. NPDC014733]|uniref:hypothetical protein n=1 Tax=Streptomyces sp. NPDC014733 TaxID=3364885 RepID=UPI0036FEFADD
MSDLYSDGAAEANKTRAAWSLHALEAFGTQTGQTYFDGSTDVGDDVLLEVAGDLLADLFHLARLNGVEPAQLIERGMTHFCDDVQEEIEEELQSEEKAVADFNAHFAELEDFLKAHS